MDNHIETWTEAAERNTILTQLDRAILQLEQDRALLELDRLQLLKLNPVHATPHWRKVNSEPRYLYLLHPTDEDGVGIREYIGNKKERVDAALARVRAYEDLAEVNRQINDILACLDAVHALLARALRLATSRTATSSAVNSRR